MAKQIQSIVGHDRIAAAAWHCLAGPCHMVAPGTNIASGQHGPVAFLKKGTSGLPGEGLGSPLTTPPGTENFGWAVWGLPLPVQQPSLTRLCGVRSASLPLQRLEAQRVFLGFVCF